MVTAGQTLIPPAHSLELSKQTGESRNGILRNERSNHGRIFNPSACACGLWCLAGRHLLLAAEREEYEGEEVNLESFYFFGCSAASMSSFDISAKCSSTSGIFQSRAV